MDHQRCPATAEDGVWILSHGHIGGDDGGLRFAFCIYGEVGDIAGVGPLRILQPVMFSAGIEVPPCRFEVRPFTFRHLMNVDSVFARCKIMQVKLDSYAFRVLRKGCCSHILPLSIL